MQMFPADALEERVHFDLLGIVWVDEMSRGTAGLIKGDFREPAGCLLGHVLGGTEPQFPVL